MAQRVVETEPDVTEASEPTLVVAYPDGAVCDLPGLRALGRSGRLTRPLDPSELMPLPYGTRLFLLPDRRPLAAEKVEVPPGTVAVAACLPARHLALRLPAYVSEPTAKPLPLLSYAAVCWYRGQLQVAAFQVDQDPKHDPHMFLENVLRRYIKRMQKQFPRNRLVAHLAERCATCYACANARNFF